MNNRIAKRVYMGECVGNCLVSCPQKKWIDKVNDCLKKKKRGLNVREARRMVHDRSEW